HAPAIRSPLPPLLLRSPRQPLDCAADLLIAALASAHPLAAFVESQVQLIQRISNHHIERQLDQLKHDEPPSSKASEFSLRNKSALEACNPRATTACFPARPPVCSAISSANTMPPCAIPASKNSPMFWLITR